MLPEFLGPDVSRESLEKLEIYYALLLRWGKAINLVSPKTLEDAWVRHFADSAQIERFVSRESRALVDLGSGAGFPGMVLAILRPGLEVHLIESDARKCEFLRTVSRETKVPLRVHTQRIEAGLGGVAPDFVTARALADLEALLGFVLPWAHVNPALQCVFLKGARFGDEVAAARQAYDFDIDVHESVTDPSGRILVLRDIKSRA